jgi:predicted signal transduction protein with EAL and GGDEF domain
MSWGLAFFWLGVGLQALVALFIIVSAIRDVEITKLTGLDPRNDARAAAEAAKKVRKADS